MRSSAMSISERLMKMRQEAPETHAEPWCCTAVHQFILLIKHAAVTQGTVSEGV